MKRIYFILGCSILNAAASFSGILGLQLQFLIVSLLFYFGGILLLRNTPFKNKIINYVLIFGFFPSCLILAYIYSFFSKNFLGEPLVYITMISIITSVFIYKKRLKTIALSSFIFILFSGMLTLLLPNYYSYRSGEIVPDYKNISDIEIYNSENKDPNFKKGKILVFDIWDSSCSVCIREFPKFEDIKTQYKNDSIVEFYSLNLYLERDSRENLEEYTNQYSFEKLYAGESVRKQLNITSLPKYMIVDQNLNILYIGTLNTGKLDFYNNFNSIINKIKNDESF